MNIYVLTARAPLKPPSYEGIVVCAESEEDAMTIPPKEYMMAMKPGSWWSNNEVDILCIGSTNKSIPRGLVLASFIE